MTTSERARHPGEERPAAGGPDEGLLARSAHRLSRSLELDEILGTTRDLVIEAVGCEKVSLLIYDTEKERHRFYLIHNLIRTDASSSQADRARDVKELFLEREEGLAGWILRNTRPQRINDAAADTRIQHELHRRLGVDIRQVLAVPLSRGRKHTGVLVAVNKPGGFTERDEQLLVTISENVSLALANALLYRRSERERRELESLYRVGLELGRPLMLGELLPKVLRLLGEVIPHDAAAIYLLDEAGKELDLFLSQGYDEAMEKRVGLKLGQGAVGWVAKNGQPLLMDDVFKDARYFNARPSTRSELVVPLTNEGRIIGAFNLESDRESAFEPSHVKLLTTFASQAASAIERARLHEEVLEKRKLEQEVAIARTIQQRLFPPDPPRLEGFALAGLNFPSLLVSGDLYDYVTVAPGHIGVMIADVSGKGVPAALVGATLRASLRMEIRNTYSISRILAGVNSLLLESLEPGRFVTGVYGVLDVQGRCLTYCNAGHNPPLWLRSDDTVEWLWEGGTVLGAYPGSRFKEQVISLSPGDIVVLYTDGITEAYSRGDRDEFGSDRLVEVVRRERHRAPEEIGRRLVDASRLYEGRTQADDLTVLVIKAQEAAETRHPGQA